MVELVDKLLNLNNQLTILGIENSYETTKLKEEIKKIDMQVDDLVYDIYGLDESERQMIESSIE